MHGSKTSVLDHVLELAANDWRHWLKAAFEACREAGEVERHYFLAPELAVESKADSTPVTAADRGAEAAIREILKKRTPEFGVLGEEFGADGDQRDRWVIDPLDGTKNFVAGLPHFAILLGLEIDGQRAFGCVHCPALGPGQEEPAHPMECGRTWWAARGLGAFRGTGTDPLSERWTRLSVQEQDDLSQASVIHGGLVHFQTNGLWPALTELVPKVGRTRGFGDFWGHMLVAEGRATAMIDPVVAYHDVAAIEPIVEEAGGVFRTRGGKPLGPSYVDSALSVNADLAGEFIESLGF